MLEKGKKIGDYYLVEKIGHGGFGDVWRAEKRTQLSVTSFALKFFHPKKSDEVNVAEIQREIEVWQAVSGLPNIISVIEADYAEDYIYIVSEYAAGGSMQRWLAANGGRADTVEQAIKITLEILNGLSHLHRSGFIHRDIKPANILIRKGTFCLADFGVTREIKTQSITMHTAGTYQYIPPEAFSKKPAVSAETDIWAVGVILQELLTGRTPFPHDEIPSLMYSVLHEEPEEMTGDIPDSLRRIVHRALRKQRGDRFSSAQEMMDDLKEVLTEDTDFDVPMSEENIPVVLQQTAPKDTIVDTAFAKTEKLDQELPASPKESVSEKENIHERESLFEKEDVLRKENVPEKEVVQEREDIPEDTISVPAPVIVSSARRKAQKRLFITGVVGAGIITLGVLFSVLGLFSTSAAEYFQQGLNCAANEDFDCAIDNYTEAINIQPNSAEPLKLRAAAFYAKGDFEKAIQDYNRAAEINPNDPNIFYGRGVAFFNRADYDRALENYNKALALNSQDEKLFYNRGLAFFSKGVFDRALEDYNRAIELNPEYAEAFHNRGNIYDEQEKYDLAIKEYDRAIELNPNFALAYSNRGAAYGRKGNYDRAVADFTRAIELNPNFATSYFNRGNIFYLRNNYDEALKDFSKTIELNGNIAMAFANRGVIRSKQGNYEQAIEDYTQAIALDPRDEQSYFNRSVAFERIGNKDKAQADRNRYQELKNN